MEPITRSVMELITRSVVEPITRSVMPTLHNPRRFCRIPVRRKQGSCTLAGAAGSVKCSSPSSHHPVAPFSLRLVELLVGPVDQLTGIRDIGSCRHRHSQANSDLVGPLRLAKLS